jgi:hypothetical protein
VVLEFEARVIIKMNDFSLLPCFDFYIHLFVECYRGFTCNSKIKGPDNPTCHLLPTNVVAGRGRKERQRRWWRIEK